MTLMTDQEGIPFARLVIHVVFEENRVRGFIRLFAQRHIGFVGGIITFFGIAPFAGRHEVEPGILTATGPGHDVVDRQVFPDAAVLAFMIITLEYILPGKINALVRGVNISVQTDHRRHGVTVRYRMQLVTIRSTDHFALIEEHEDKGTLHGANH